MKLSITKSTIQVFSKKGIWMSVLFIVLFCFKTDNLVAQVSEVINTDLRPDPLTPEASKFLRYGKQGVNKVTGTPQIQIPLYQVKYKGMTLPISLEYNASGIKVGAVSSSVGLNWSLKVGGSINRTVKGARDEGESIYAENANFGIKGYYKDYGLTTLDDALNTKSEGDRYDPASPHARYRYFFHWLNDLSRGASDSQPDVFHVYLPNGEHSPFVFNQDRTPVLLEKKDIKIQETFSDNQFTSWNVWSPTGIRYSFNIANADASYSRSYLNMGHSDANPDEYITNSWFLSEVFNPATNSSIQIDYKINNYSDIYFNLPIGTSIPCSIMVPGCDAPANQPPYGLFTHEPYVISDYISQANPNMTSKASAKYMSNRVHSKVIEKITAGLTEVRFFYSDREDLGALAPAAPTEKAQRLDAIEIWYDQNLIKKYTFDYEYRESEDLSDDHFSGYQSANQPYLKKHLFLTGLNEWETENEAEKKTHQFIYNDQIPSHRLSLDRDKWGYHNGKENNKSLFPAYKNEDVEDVADRSVSLADSKTGILEQIVYPTRGSVHFEYENHISDVAVGQIPGDTAPNNLLNILEHELLPVPQTTYINSSFTVPEDYHASNKPLYLFLNLMGKYVNLPMECNNYYASGIFVLNITDAATDERVYNTSISPPSDTYDFSSIHTIISPQLGQYFQPNQEYNIEFRALGDKTACLLATIRIYEEEVLYNNVYTVGGLRVKKITHKDNDQVLLTKEYQYEEPKLLINPQPVHKVNFDAHTMFDSLENIISDANIDYLKTVLNTEDPNEEGAGYFYILSPGHDHFMVDQTSNHITYGKIIETEISDNQIIEEEYYYHPFSTYEELNPLHNLGITYPNKPVEQLPNAGRQRVYYTANGGNSLTQEWLYDLSGQPTTIPAIVTSGPFNGLNLNSFQVYYPKSQGVLLSEERDTRDDVLTKRQYLYEGNGHHQTTSKIVTHGDNNETIIRQYYPPDLLDPSHPLNIQHRIAQPIKVESYIKKDGTDTEDLLSTQIVNYATGENTSGLTLISDIEVAKGNHSSIKKLEYQKYDEVGNILQTKQFDGTVTTYIWSYDKAYPIAKIQNTTFAQVASALEISENDLMNFNETNLFQIDNLRATLPHATITTYTYDPLIGLTNITDSRSETAFYNYDDFHRLKRIKNHDDNTVKTYNYNYAQEAPEWAPLQAAIDYGSSNDNYQWFTSNISGGSGDYSYAWYQGIGSSSISFHESPSGNGSSYQLMVNCISTRYVKLEVTDNITGEIIIDISANDNKPCISPPLNAQITYGPSNDNSQWFFSNVSGGSGNYSYAWYKGIGSSSVNFQNTPANTSSSYQMSVPCTTLKYVKLVITDNVTGDSIIRKKSSNNNPCTGDENEH